MSHNCCSVYVRGDLRENLEQRSKVGLSVQRFHKRYQLISQALGHGAPRSGLDPEATEVSSEAMSQ